MVNNLMNQLPVYVFVTNFCISVLKFEKPARPALQVSPTSLVIVKVVAWQATTFTIFRPARRA